MDDLEVPQFQETSKSRSIPKFHPEILKVNIDHPPFGCQLEVYYFDHVKFKNWRIKFLPVFWIPSRSFAHSYQQWNMVRSCLHTQLLRPYSDNHRFGTSPVPVWSHTVQWRKPLGMSLQLWILSVNCVANTSVAKICQDPFWNPGSID